MPSSRDYVHHGGVDCNLDMHHYITALVIIGLLRPIRYYDIHFHV